MNKPKNNNRLKPISLYPLKPEQALSAFMKINPENAGKNVEGGGVKMGGNLRRAICSSDELKIGGFAISCAVLEDETRVLVSRSLANALGRRGGGRYWEKKKLRENGAVLPEYVSARYLRPFISSELRIKLTTPTVYINAKGIVTEGFDATILPEICDVWIKSAENGALTPKHQEIAKNAYILLKGIANIGITALVDEATGYQNIRTRDSLQKILEKFIAKELRPWVKTFPDQFYENLFRLKNWQYKPLSVFRPSVVGRITNDLIYKRLAPGVLDELKAITPRDEKGRTKHRFHQRLTENVGHPKLREHLASVVALMRASPSWHIFQRLINRALPQYGKTPELPFPDKEIEKLGEEKTN